jgi:protein translocase SecG subunit
MVVQIVIATTLVLLILVQAKGTGFGRSANATSFTRRGLEKVVFKLTFVVTGLFILISLLQLFV